MKTPPFVIILVETVWGSIVRDAGTLLMFVIMLGLGVVLQSAAMQWIGGIVFLMWFFGRAISLEKNNRMTIQQARDKLDDLEAKLKQQS